MEFRISDTFTSSLAKLSGDEQKAVKTTAFDLQMNPANPGHSFHKLDKVQDRQFWSVRANRDIRIIVHKSRSSLLLCYVDHHDNAYKWAEKRKIETHPKTGAAQLVEIRERVEEIRVQQVVLEKVEQTSKPLPFNLYSEEELLNYGVPKEWLPDVLAADEDSILEIAAHLPAEASEAMLEIAVGNKPQLPSISFAQAVDPFEHPDAQRRFRTMVDKDELERALDFPWEKWTVFLHPAQKELVEKDFGGPARVTGSAGTGKTIVALHRSVYLARENQEARVLLTTFTDALANALMEKRKQLIGQTPRLAERLEIASMDAIAIRLYKYTEDKRQVVDRHTLLELVTSYANGIEGGRFTPTFIFEEWSQVVDAWQIKTWDEYRQVPRLGRKARLSEAQREKLWCVFEQVNKALIDRQVISMAGVYLALTDKYSGTAAAPYDFVIVDEAQDISVPQLRFLAALGSKRPDSLFFAGDQGQRIFQQAFSWKSLGVDIRGRSSTLRVNYRTSHQIRIQADRLLGPTVSDVDCNSDDRTGTVSVFNGPVPVVKNFNSTTAEIEGVADWLTGLYAENFEAHEVGVIVRSSDEMDRAISAVKKSGAAYTVLDSYIQQVHGKASICTMHLAKGMEFRAVAVMACDDEVIPSQKRIDEIADTSDLEEVYETERHLLYVACTRARDRLLVTSGDEASEFLVDLAEMK